MAGKTIIRKVFINKKNKQMSVSLSKKEIRTVDPTIKFGKHLFVRLEVFNKERK